MKKHFSAGLAAFTLTSLALLAPLAAQAQSVPAYAASYATDGQIRGRIASFDGGYNLVVRDERGYIDNVRLHPGTIINPTGLTLRAGMIVSILGFNQGSFFGANEIDTPYTFDAGVPYYYDHPWFYYGPAISLGFYFGNPSWWHGGYFSGGYGWYGGVRVYNAVHVGYGWGYHRWNHPGPGWHGWGPGWGHPAWNHPAPGHAWGALGWDHGHPYPPAAWNGSNHPYHVVSAERFHSAGGWHRASVTAWHPAAHGGFHAVAHGEFHPLAHGGSHGEAHGRR